MKLTEFAEELSTLEKDSYFLTGDTLKHLAATVMAVSFFLPVLHTQKEHIYEIDKWICFIKKPDKPENWKKEGAVVKNGHFNFPNVHRKCDERSLQRAKLKNWEDDVPE